MRRPLELACAALLATTIAAPARADENKDQAKILFAAGAAAYEKRDYVGAIKAFEAAERLAPHPAIVFSLAQAHRRQYYADGKPEQLRAALDGYREYVKLVPKGARHDDATQALQELGASSTPTREQDAASISVNSSGTRNARVAIDDGAPVEPPFIGPVAAGVHHVVISAEGYVSEAREITAVDGKMVALDVPLREKPAHVTLAAPSGARVDVDGRPMGDAPLATPLELAAGVHLVSVTQNGHDAFVREIDLSRGEERKLDAALPPSRQRKIAIAMLVGAGVTAAAGAAFLSVALVEQAQAVSYLELQKTRALTQAEGAAYTDIRNARIDWSIVTGATFAAAAALGVAGVLLFSFDTPSTTSAAHRDLEHTKPKPNEHKNEPVEMAVSPILSPSTVGVAALLRF